MQAWFNRNLGRGLLKTGKEKTFIIQGMTDVLYKGGRLVGKIGSRVRSLCQTHCWRHQRL